MSLSPRRVHKFPTPWRPGTTMARPGIPGLNTKRLKVDGALLTGV